MLPKYPFLKHSLNHISLINAREKNKAGKENRVLGLRMEGVPFLNRVVKEDLTENGIYEERTEEVRKQATWLPGEKSILTVKNPETGVCLICLRNSNKISRAGAQ